MSATTIMQIDCTTDQVVTLPTPSAPPETLEPLTTATSAISTPNSVAFPMPCQMSPVFSTVSESFTKAPSEELSAAET